MAQTASLALTRVSSDGTTETVTDIDVSTTNETISINIDGATIGELRVLRDPSGRTTVALGQYDRRAHDWKAMPSITRRGGWIESDDKGFYPVYDGRRLPGMVYPDIEQAQIALSVIETMKGN